MGNARKPKKQSRKRHTQSANPIVRGTKPIAPDTNEVKRTGLTLSTKEKILLLLGIAPALGSLPGNDPVLSAIMLAVSEIVFLWLFIAHAGSRLWRVVGALVVTAILSGVGLRLYVDSSRKNTASERSAPSSAELQANVIRDLDTFIAGKDESALQDFFGVRTMIEANIQYESDRIAHFERGAKEELPVGPYVKDGTTSMDTSIMSEGGRLQPQGGGHRYDPDHDSVYQIIVPKSYTDGMNLLFKYETSIGAPGTVVSTVKDLRNALAENQNTLIKVLNEALHANKRYFLQYYDSKSMYWASIDAMYYKRLIPLKPKADAIRESARAFLGVK